MWLTHACGDATWAKPTLLFAYMLHTCIAHTIACSIQRLVRITNGYATAFFSTVYPTNHHASVLFLLWKLFTANSDLLVCCRLTHLISPASLPGSIRFRASSNFLLFGWPWHQEREAVSQQLGMEQPVPPRCLHICFTVFTPRDPLTAGVPVVTWSRTTNRSPDSPECEYIHGQCAFIDAAPLALTERAHDLGQLLNLPG